MRIHRFLSVASFAAMSPSWMPIALAGFLVAGAAGPAAAAYPNGIVEPPGECGNGGNFPEERHDIEVFTAAGVGAMQSPRDGGSNCGNGIPEVGEECDDGNLTSYDDCKDDCTHNVCGDGVPNTGGSNYHPCDDGNDSNNDECVNTCTYNYCGDGHVFFGSEPCDDGNLVNRDGCDQTCTVTGPDNCSAPQELTLGSHVGVLVMMATTSPFDPTHSCTGSKDHYSLWYSFTPIETARVTFLATNSGTLPDPVVSVYTGTCNSLGPEVACHTDEATATVTFVAEAGTTYLLQVGDSVEGGQWYNLTGVSIDVFRGCGDGVVEDDEWCDDANDDDTDACHNDCNINGECGNDIVEGGLETCDDGNLIDGDGCSSTCRLPCPLDLCACLGEASKFSMMGKAITLAPQKVAAYGESYYLEAAVGSICALSGKFSGKLDAETSIDGDLVLTQSDPKKSAVKFIGFRDGGDAQPGVLVHGDFVTGGGGSTNLGAAEINGVYDITGTHPLVGVCQQAKIDLPAASTTFKNMPGTNLGAILVERGDSREIEAGEGIAVLNIDSIRIKTGRDEDGYPVPSELRFVFGDDTDAIIINVAGDITLGEECAIIIDGSPEAVILNMHGAGRKLKLKKYAFIEPAIVGPGLKTVSVQGTELANVLSLGNIKMKGGYAFDSLGCPEH